MGIQWKMAVTNGGGAEGDDDNDDDNNNDDDDEDVDIPEDLPLRAGVQVRDELIAEFFTR